MAIKLLGDLQGVVLELNQRKCELTVLNHTEKEIQMFGRLKELLPHLKLVPTAEPLLLLEALLSKEGISVAIREKSDNLERIVFILKTIEKH